MMDAQETRPALDAGQLDRSTGPQLDAPLGAAPAQDTPPAVEQAPPLDVPPIISVHHAALAALGVELLYWGDRAWGVKGMTGGLFAFPEEAIFWAAWELGRAGIEPDYGEYWCTASDNGEHSASEDGAYCIHCEKAMPAYDEDEEGGE